MIITKLKLDWFINCYLKTIFVRIKKDNSIMFIKNSNNVELLNVGIVLHTPNHYLSTLLPYMHTLPTSYSVDQSTDSTPSKMSSPPSKTSNSGEAEPISPVFWNKL